MKYHESCHYGRIAFEVEGEIAEVAPCNASTCQRNGMSRWFRRDLPELKVKEFNARVL
jgi:hypothetical protein